MGDLRGEAGRRVTIVALAALAPRFAGDAVEEHALGEAFVIVGAAPVLRGALEVEVVVEAPVAVGVGKEERARRPGFAEAFDHTGDKGAADAEAAGAGPDGEKNNLRFVCDAGICDKSFVDDVARVEVGAVARRGDRVRLLQAQLDLVTLLAPALKTPVSPVRAGVRATNARRLAIHLGNNRKGGPAQAVEHVMQRLKRCVLLGRGIRVPKAAENLGERGQV